MIIELDRKVSCIEQFKYQREILKRTMCKLGYAPSLLLYEKGFYTYFGRKLGRTISDVIIKLVYKETINLR